MLISEHGTVSNDSHMLLQRKWRLDARDQTSCTRGTDFRCRRPGLHDRSRTPNARDAEFGEL